MIISNCRICGVEFNKTRVDKIVCSKACSCKMSLVKRRFKVNKNINITNNTSHPEKLKCLYCGDIFDKTRSDKRTCSYSCSNKYSYSKRSVESYSKEVKPEGDKRICSVCDVEKNVNEFYSYKNIMYKQCKVCIYEKKKNQRDGVGLVNTPFYYHDLEKFVLGIKRKRYIANYTDIMELINIYDIVYPGGIVPSGDLEDAYNMIFYKLAKKYDIYRSMIVNIKDINE
jgi:hypothetical protein